MLKTADKDVFVDLHNSWRSKAATGQLTGNKKAKILNLMQWDNELEKSAKAYADLCNYQHSSEVGHSILPYTYGENLALTNQQMNTTYVIEWANNAWAEEHVDFDHDTLECTPRKKCGHYTQMVWESSIRIGCAVSVCSEINAPEEELDGMAAMYVVCHYFPPGNFRGNPPYEYDGKDLVSTSQKAKTDYYPDQSKSNPNQIPVSQQLNICSEDTSRSYTKKRCKNF